MSILRDGFKTLFTCSLNPTLYAEIEVTPPGVGGRGAIDQTTMRNAAWVTRIAKALKDLTEMQAVISWDPALYSTVNIALVQRNQLMTLTFPDTSSLIFWAEIDAFKPGAHKEGERPTATLTIIPTNISNTCQETPPAYFPPTSAYACA